MYMVAPPSTYQKHKEPHKVFASEKDTLGV